MVSFLEETLSSQVPSSYIQSKPKILCKFWYIGIDDIDRSNIYARDFIHESSKFHNIYSFSVVDPTKVMVRDLACFCSPWVSENWEACWNKSHVLPWRLIKLKPINNRLVHDQMEEYEDQEKWEFGGDGEGIIKFTSSKGQLCGSNNRRE